MLLSIALIVEAIDYRCEGGKNVGELRSDLGAIRS
jgi:hypothetical protein